VTDVHGAPLDFTHGPLLKSNTGVIATNTESVHEQVLDALHAAAE
jgi:3'(2'), 5'-bisphosphate nucleotidase